MRNIEFEQAGNISRRLHKPSPRLGDPEKRCHHIFREFSMVRVKCFKTVTIDHLQSIGSPSRTMLYLVISPPIKDNSNRRSVIFLIVKHEIEAGSAQHIAGSAPAPAPAGALLHPVPDDRAVGGQRFLSNRRPPAFVFRFVALPEGVRI